MRFNIDKKRLILDLDDNEHAMFEHACIECDVTKIEMFRHLCREANIFPPHKKKPLPCFKKDL